MSKPSKKDEPVEAPAKSAPKPEPTRNGGCAHTPLAVHNAHSKDPSLVGFLDVDGKPLTVSVCSKCMLVYASVD